jgi:hypothetical protein
MLRESAGSPTQQSKMRSPFYILCFVAPIFCHEYARADILGHRPILGKRIAGSYAMQQSQMRSPFYILGLSPEYSVTVSIPDYFASLAMLREGVVVNTGNTVSLTTRSHFHVAGLSPRGCSNQITKIVNKYGVDCAASVSSCARYLSPTAVRVLLKFD